MTYWAESAGFSRAADGGRDSTGEPTARATNIGQVNPCREAGAVAVVGAAVRAVAGGGWGSGSSRRSQATSPQPTAATAAARQMSARVFDTRKG